MVKLESAQLDDALHALADVNRRRLLQAICGKRACVTELAEAFDISLVAVSKHLKVLERAELITRHKQGRSYFFSPVPATLDRVDALLEHYRAFWQGSFDRLEAALEADA
ncbi:MAG: ArsR/SmtB family transcription factor [Opitutales bacterium]